MTKDVRWSEGSRRLKEVGFQSDAPPSSCRIDRHEEAATYGIFVFILRIHVGADGAPAWQAGVQIQDSFISTVVSHG